MLIFPTKLPTGKLYLKTEVLREDLNFKLLFDLQDYAETHSFRKHVSINISLNGISEGLGRGKSN